MSEPRIIKYNSDKYIEEGDYYGAVWESLKESGILTLNKKINLCNQCPYMDRLKRNSNEIC